MSKILWCFAWQHSALFTPSERNADCQFGNSVALSGDASTIAIASWGAHAGGDTKGQIYLYSLNNGSWQSTIYTTLDGADNDYFGKAVTVNEDGKAIAASAYEDDISYPDQGSVYIIDNMQ